MFGALARFENGPVFIADHKPALHMQKRTRGIYNGLHLWKRRATHEGDIPSRKLENLVVPKIVRTYRCHRNRVTNSIRGRKESYIIIIVLSLNEMATIARRAFGKQ